MPPVFETEAVLIALIITAFLTAGCVSSPARQGTVEIYSTATTHSPEMSSTVGIDLTPYFSESRPGPLLYHWTAEYGTFVTWNAPEFKVIERGNDTYCGNETVYWTYRADRPGEGPETVIVRLSIEDPKTGEVFARAEKILVKDSRGYRIEGQ